MAGGREWDDFFVVLVGTRGNTGTTRRMVDATSATTPAGAAGPNATSMGPTPLGRRPTWVAGRKSLLPSGGAQPVRPLTDASSARLIDHRTDVPRRLGPEAFPPDTPPPLGGQIRIGTTCMSVASGISVASSHPTMAAAFRGPRMICTGKLRRSPCVSRASRKAGESACREAHVAVAGLVRSRRSARPSGELCLAHFSDATLVAPRVRVGSFASSHITQRHERALIGGPWRATSSVRGSGRGKHQVDDLIPLYADCPLAERDIPE